MEVKGEGEGSVLRRGIFFWIILGKDMQDTIMITDQKKKLARLFV